MPPNKEQRERLKDWLDVAEKLGDADAHGFQRVREPLTTLEGYRNGGLEAHFHIGIRSGLFSENRATSAPDLRRATGVGGFPKARPGSTLRIEKSRTSITFARNLPSTMVGTC